LKAPDLLDRISKAFATCGLVGEHTNKLVGYLAAVSRKLTRPLAVMVQSSSAAGKSALMDAVLAFVPEEERVQYSAMTGQSLFYMGETDLQHKVLAIAEEEGAERASYPLKLLQSEGKLSIASTGKDPSSGRLVTHEYHVEGPAAILLTTTAIDLDEELLNRCVVLAVDESREQTRAIHRLQLESRTLEGLEHRLARQDIVKLHQNAQRLLRPLFVVNPFARHLTFLDDTTRTRRDHEKYLGLIDALALLHQHQREVRTGVVRGRRVDYVEATLSDIAMANELASEALGRTLDELPPQTRRLLEMLYGLVAAKCEAEKVDVAEIRFSRREVLIHSRWSYPQVRKHLDRLVEHEYLLVHRGMRGQSFVYELLWQGEGREGESFVMGLIPAEKLREDSGTTSALTPLKQPLTPEGPDFDPLLTPIAPRLTPL
jgi:DNA primase